MRLPRFHLASLTLAFALAAPAVVIPRAALADDTLDPAVASVKADEQFRRGKAFVKAGNLAAAREAYLEGWNLKKGFDIAGNLGNVELELGLARDAAEHLSYCVRNFPATGTPRALEYARERLAAARKRVGALSLRVSVDGAEIFVDGKSVGRAPIAEELFVDPGARTVEARLTGYHVAKSSFDASAGSSHALALTLAPLPNKPLIVVRQAPAIDAVPKKKSMVPVYVGASVAGAGVAVGIGTLIASSVIGGDATAMRADLQKKHGTSACLNTANAAACDKLDGAYATESRLRSVAIGSFAIGGAAAIAALVYGLLPNRAPARTGLRPDVLAAPGGAGLGLSGEF